MDSVNSIAARILSALAGADILAVHHGDGVLSCGDTAADHPSAEVAFGEIMVIVGENCDEVSVGVIWRNDEGEAIDGDDTGFDTGDLDGIVAEVKRLTGGA